MTIRNKLIAIQVATAVIVLLGASAFLLYIQFGVLKEMKVMALSSEAEVLGINCVSSIQFMDKAAAVEELSSLKSDRQIINALLLDTNGKTFAAYHHSEQPDEASLNIPVQLENSFVYTDNFLFLTYPVKKDGKLLGTLFLQATLEDIDRVMIQYVYTIAIVLLLATILAFIVAVFLGRTIANPIKKLINVVRDIATTTNYKQSVPIDSQDELGKLGEEFNQMLDIIRIKDELLKKSNEQLEVMVQERTAALQKANIELEENNEELKEFTYAISHHLKSPVRAMGSLVEWIEEDVAAKASEDTSSNLKLLQGRISRLDRLINALLDYVKIGRLTTNKTQVDLNILLQQIINNINKDKRAVVNVSSDFPVLTTDKVKISIVFHHLIDNAFRHSNTATPIVDISFTEKQDFWEFAVKDNGPGIEPEYHDRIFTMFQTLEARDQQDNTGAGLAIAKKIVEEQNAYILVKSEIDQGTTFIFTWPK